MQRDALPSLHYADPFDDRQSTMHRLLVRPDTLTASKQTSGARRVGRFNAWSVICRADFLPETRTSFLPAGTPHVWGLTMWSMVASDEY